MYSYKKTTGRYKQRQATTGYRQQQQQQQEWEEQLIAASAVYQINCACKSTFYRVWASKGAGRGKGFIVTSCKCACVSVLCVCVCCHLMINCNKTLVIQSKNINKRGTHEYDKWHYVLCSYSSCWSRLFGRRITAMRGEAGRNGMGWDGELLLPALQSLSFLLSSPNVFRVIRVLASSSRYLPLSVLPCFRFWLFLQWEHVHFSSVRDVEYSSSIFVGLPDGKTHTHTRTRTHTFVLLLSRPRSHGHEHAHTQPQTGCA